MTDATDKPDGPGQPQTQNGAPHEAASAQADRPAGQAAHEAQSHQPEQDGEAGAPQAQAPSPTRPAAGTPSQAAPAKPGRRAVSPGAKSLVLGAGGALALLTLAGFGLSLRPGEDEGGHSPSAINGLTPDPANDSMKAVGKREADKRAIVNKGQADEHQAAGTSYVAQPVIVAERGPELGELPQAPSTPSAPTAPSAPPAPPVPPAAPAATPGPVHETQTVPVPDPVMVRRINDQIAALLTPREGGFVVRQFARGERPAPPAPQRGASATNWAGGPPIPRPLLIARPGDTALARLDRAFNSDDPAAPLFATIEDIDAYGRPGPLHGVRLMGAIAYSPGQGAVTFSQIIWQNGMTAPLKAIAVSWDAARTGIARNADYHTLERYGSLALSGSVANFRRGRARSSRAVNYAVMM